MRTPRGMTVSDLIAALQGFDDDAIVMFCYDYGDHWHTNVANAINEVEEATVTYSEYHRMHKVVDLDGMVDDCCAEADGDETNNKEHITTVMLRC